jgi:hypothetical protein
MDSRRERAANQKILEQNPKPTVAPEKLLDQLLRMGVPLISLGAGSLLALYFSWSIAAVYLGAFFLFFRMHKLPMFKQASSARRWWYRLGYAAAVAAFTAWVFWPTTINMNVASLVPAYGPGTNINGILWKNDYAQATLFVENPGGADLHDFDMLLSTDLKIEEMKMIGGLASCSAGPVTPPVPVTVQPNIGGVPAGPAIQDSQQYVVVPLGPDGLPIPSDGSYRVICDKFPAGDKLSFVAAVTVLPDKGTLLKSPYGKPRNPEWFTAKMSFSVAGRPKTASITHCKTGQNCSS